MIDWNNWEVALATTKERQIERDKVNEDNGDKLTIIIEKLDALIKSLQKGKK